MLHSKKPPVARKFSEDVPFERNRDLTSVIFFRGRLRGHRAYSGGSIKLKRGFQKTQSRGSGGHSPPELKLEEGVLIS